MLANTVSTSRIFSPQGANKCNPIAFEEMTHDYKAKYLRFLFAGTLFKYEVSDYFPNS